MPPVKAKARRIVFERLLSGQWMGSVPSIKGCAAQGRTIDEARRRVVALVTLKLGSAPGEFSETVVLPVDARRLLRQSHEARQRAEESRQLAQEAVEQVVSVLTKALGLSVRDVSELVGLSHQRVHQVRTQTESASAGKPAGSQRARR